MDTYAIEWLLEDALYTHLGSTLGGVNVYKGITETLDAEGNAAILPETHIAVYVPAITPLHPENEGELIWSGEVVLTVATWQDETLPSPYTSVRDYHRDLCVSLRTKVWDDALATTLTDGQLTIGRVIVGAVENEPIGRHHVTRHHLALMGVAVAEE